jgi:6,7-dimethyl-8-ribityllumazine synthase
LPTKIKIEHPAPTSPKAIEGGLDASGHSFGIVVSRFNAFITERLLASALDALRRTGAKDRDIHIVRVPGAFEIPSAARALAQTGKVDAIICLGCLLRGETSNYEHICEEVTRGVGQSAQETGVPHSWGVLTCDNLEQAIDRAGLKSGNKGFEAALAAVEMASVKTALSAQQSAVGPSGKVASRQLPVASKRKPPKSQTKKKRSGSRK